MLLTNTRELDFMKFKMLLCLEGECNLTQPEFGGAGST